MDNVRVTGYPGKKKGIMKTAKGKALEDKPYTILYVTDTTGGQSGSPVYRGSTVYGVHSRGVKDKQYNAAYRITKNSFEWLLSFR